jgi:quercetin dioxygenase-like cupin family protein
MFKDFKDIKPKQLLPGFKARFIHTNTQTLSLVEVEEGASLPTHSHFHEQISNVIDGEFELTIDGVSKVCRKGDIAIIGSNVDHSGKAITNCTILDIFTPVREDYK